MAHTPVPGSIVTVWEGGELALAVVIGEEKRRLRMIVENGREIRVQPSRIGWAVEERGPVPGITIEERREAGRRVAEVEKQVATQVEQVDVGVLWEIVIESQEGASKPGSFFTAELAELALDSRSGVAMTAVARALRGDAIHFARKAEEWVPRSRDQVDELEKERERVLARESQTAAFFEALNGAVRTGEFVATGGEYETRYLDALYQLAVHEDGAPEGARGLALEALEASKIRHDRPHEGAFRLLRLVGRIDDDDVNLQVLRFGLRTSFPDEVLAHAADLAARGFDGEGREDLTHLEVLSIDGPRTCEIDDALSLVRTDDGFRLGVHIADPGALIGPDDPIDREALVRGLTHYHPDVRLPMLPAVLGEDAASLVAGVPRPALSFLIDLDPAAGVRDSRVVRSVVRTAARLDYEGVDRTLALGDGPYAATLAGLAHVGALREQRRIEQGAVSIHAPEVEVYVDGDGEIRLDRIDDESAARRAVSEAMILAGEIAAHICREAGIPSVYRRQAPPDRGALEQFDDRVRGAVEVRRARRSLNRGTVSSKPGPHHGLGVEAYVQITSPLRRFQDLAMHRQLAAHLVGLAPPYDAEAMQRILATTDRADRDARRAERGAEEFWRLRYLEAKTGDEVEAVVVETEPRTVVQLLETLHEQPMPALTGVEEGSVVRLRIEHVNPRAGKLVLRRVDS